MPYRPSSRYSSKHPCLGQGGPSSSNQTLPPLCRTKNTESPHRGHFVGRQVSKYWSCQLKRPRGRGCVPNPPGERPRCPSPPKPHLHSDEWYKALHISPPCHLCSATLRIGCGLSARCPGFNHKPVKTAR